MVPVLTFCMAEDAVVLAVELVTIAVVASSVVFSWKVGLAVEGKVGAWWIATGVC